MNPDRDKVNFLSPDRLWDPPSLIFSVRRGTSLGLKRLERDVDYSHPSSAQVRTGISGAVPLRPYVNMSWTG